VQRKVFGRVEDGRTREYKNYMDGRGATRRGEMRNTYNILVGKRQGTQPLARRRRIILNVIVEE
jgi:hypothetical protein